MRGKMLDMRSDVRMTRDPRLVYALGNISLVSPSSYRSRFYILYQVYVNVKDKCKSIMQGQEEGEKTGGVSKISSRLGNPTIRGL